jgi:hypothetical protein
MPSETTPLPYPSPSSTFQLQPCRWTATSSFLPTTRPPMWTRPIKAGPLVMWALATIVFLVEVLPRHPRGELWGCLWPLEVVRW